MSDLLHKVENGIATLTFNRPEAMNALSQETFEVGIPLLEQWAQDDDVRCRNRHWRPGLLCRRRCEGHECGPRRLSLIHI